MDTQAGTITSGSSPITKTTPTNPMAGAPIVSTPDLARANISQAQTTLNQAKADMSAQAQAKGTAQPNVSVVDYLASTGKPSDFASRATLAKNAGIANYTGTADQNTQLLNILKSGAPQQGQPTQPTQQVQPTAPTAQPTKIPTAAQNAFLSSNAGQPFTYQKDAQGNVTYYDYQGNQLSQNPLGAQYNQTPENTPGFGTLIIPQQAGGISAGTPAQDQSTIDFQNQMNGLNSKIDTAYTDYQNSINSIRNGTFPLTASQQAQIDAINQQFQQMRTVQLLANKNYEAGITALGITSGRSRYAPELDQGLIQAAVNSGIAKINELDTKQAQTVAQLEQGFQDKNLQMIQASYTAFQNYIKQKQDAITSIKTAVDAHEKDVRDFNYKVTQDSIKNTLDSERLSLDEKNSAIKNQIDQANLSINQRKQALAETQVALQQQLLGLINNPQNPPPTKDPVTGTVSPAQQEAFLSKFPANVQSQIKAVADYKAPLSTFPQKLYKGQVGLTQADILAAASQYTGEDFNASTYAVRQKFMSNWTTSGMASLRTSANAATQHLIELTNAANALNNSDIKVLNGLKNWSKDQTGNGRITAFQTAANAFAGEYAKFIVTNLGSVQGATQEDRQGVLDMLSPKIAPDQIKAFGTTAADLMRDRMQTVQDIYVGAMGKLPDANNGVLLPSTQQKIDQLKNLGIDTDFSSVMPQNKFKNMSTEDLMNAGSATAAAKTDNTQMLQGLLQMMGQPIQ